ncbi:unnamed protein product [Penicillium palitans]
MATDSYYTFNFYQISRDGKWSSYTLHWGQDQAQNVEIFGLLLAIMVDTSQKSPFASVRSSVNKTKHRFTSSAGHDDSPMDIES